MTGECQHCWHDDKAGPICCWCGTTLHVTLTATPAEGRAHGSYAPTPAPATGPQAALGTLERVRATLREHGLSNTEDEVLEVMDQIEGWVSPHMQL